MQKQEAEAERERQHHADRHVALSELFAEEPLLLTVDSGSTTFTLFLPRVNLPAPPALPALVPVTTEGVTTTHRFSVLPPLQHGQQDFYAVTNLQGTAG